MNFRSKEFLCRSLMIVIAIGSFAGALYAQPTVSISGIPASPAAAPSASFTVTATASPTPGTSITKVVFYRNDVPYETDTSFSYTSSQAPLLQDTYIYRARAYDSSGAWTDSADVKLEVRTPRVFRMGDTIPGGSSTPGPGVNVDHTAGIKAALTYLKNQGGGTLVFPCTFGPGDQQSFYNIKETIEIPSKVTLQGESAEWDGACRIYWNDVNPQPPLPPGCHDAPENTRHQAMFRIPGATSGVRFRDLALSARNIGPENCIFLDADFNKIKNNENTAIELNASYEQACIDDPNFCSTDPGGNISDVIFENITIANFWRGISALSAAESDHQIFEIKTRGYRPVCNHRQLYIDARYAYNWDLQNINLTAMYETQGAVEIKNAGKPPGYNGDKGDLRFLQLNCNGGPAPPAFCVSVEKHGGLYFKGLHHELVNQAMIVHDISSRGTNPDPIVFESSVATGEFSDASMKLYLIGNLISATPDATPSLYVGRLRFKDAGLNSTVVDCGDLHIDQTSYLGAFGTLPYMLFTHTDRNRGSFFAESGANKYILPHTPCPSGVPGLLNINEVGGKTFDSGVMPTEAATPPDTLKQYTNILYPLLCHTPNDIATCIEELMSYDPPPGTPGFATNGGALYIPNATYQVNRAVRLLRGREIIGEPGAKLVLTASNSSLFQIQLYRLVTNGHGASNIVLRNLELETAQTKTIGIEMVGEEVPANDPCIPNPIQCVSVSRDLYFSDLKLTGFATGFHAHQFPGQEGYMPMIDGVGMKNISFVNNVTGFLNTSQNASNWNIMNLKMQWASAPAVGWSQQYGGLFILQDVSCQGVANPGLNDNDCISLQMTGMSYVSEFKKAQNVTNALTLVPGFTAFGFDEPSHVHLSLRNNDFTGSAVKVAGKAFLTSMNNKYGTINVSAQGNKTRLTHCGDSYAGPVYDALDEFQYSNWVGIYIPSRIECGTDPIAWEDAVRWTNVPSDHYDNTKPLVGSFFDNVKEDFVTYQPASPNNKFRVQQQNGPGRAEIQLGSGGDVPLVIRLYPTTTMLVAFHDNYPNSSQWKVCSHTTCDPANPTYTWTWGTTGDVPFVGNFFNEAGPVKGNADEIAIYRPSNGQIWIMNPRSGAMFPVLFVSAYQSNIQVGDFLGRGYDQIAQFIAGTGSWEIVDPRTAEKYLGAIPGLAADQYDKPVAGRYLPQLLPNSACIQLGVWRPADQKFYIAEVNPTPVGGASPTTCATRTANVAWGSNMGAPTTDDVDVPLTIRDRNVNVRRPTAFRHKRLAMFPESISDGQWWVHDKF